MNKDKSYRITVIGGGSTTFVPQLAKLLVSSAPLRNNTLALMDIDAQRLELMTAVAHSALSLRVRPNSYPNFANR